MSKRLDYMVDVESFFARADSLLNTCRIIRSYNPTVMAVCVHAVVILSACALELYMKVLAQLERGTPPLSGHNLEHLAHDLSGKSYRKMRATWLKLNGPPLEMAKKNPDHPDWKKFPKTFEEALSRGAKAFIDWRYGNDGTPGGYFLDQIVDQVRDIILDLQPDLQISYGARSILNPKTDLVKAKNDGLLAPLDFSKFNNQPATFKVEFRRRPDAEDGSSG